MKIKTAILLGIGAVCVLGACTDRRRADKAEADGDTIEVVIPEHNDSVPSI